MSRGIIVFGANGAGKSTLGRELARVLDFKYMDIEDYYFIKSEIPYTIQRERQECIDFMVSNIEKHGSFVLSAVTGDFGEEISSMYRLAVFLSVPLEVRIERVKQRSDNQYGKRICPGGDMYEQQLKFVDFVAKRSLLKMEQWAQTLVCPVIQLDGTNLISDNVKTVIQIWKRQTDTE